MPIIYLIILSFAKRSLIFRDNETNRRKQVFLIQHNMVKNPNWQEADQLAIYKRGRGVELGATEKQLQLVVRAGLEHGISALQVARPKHSTTLPPGVIDCM